MQDESGQKTEEEPPAHHLSVWRSNEGARELSVWQSNLIPGKILEQII